MSLFNNTPVDPATAAATRVVAIASQAFSQLGRSGIAGFNAIFNNPNATPAQVLAALGTNAQAVFQLASLNAATVAQAATLAGVSPPAIPSIPSRYTITFNPDGSANLVDSGPPDSANRKAAPANWSGFSRPDRAPRQAVSPAPAAK